MSFPKRFPGREPISKIIAEAEKLAPGDFKGGRARRTAGRVMARRDMGKLVFLDLVDSSGRIQLVCAPNLVPEVAPDLMDSAQRLDLGDIVGVDGAPGKTKRGEPSVFVVDLVLLAKIRRPLPDTFHGVKDPETRYRQRYLDLLINEEAREEALLRSRMVTAIRRYLDEAGFVEVETPILQARYGGGFADPFVTHYNALDRDYYLRIADELYLKRLLVGGLDKVYELAKDFRNEGLSYKHAPEFTQVEWYEAYADYRDTMERMEQLIEAVALEVLGTTRVTFRGHDVDLEMPWRRLTFVEALEAEGLWTRDAGDLRTLLESRGVDTVADKTWAQLVDHALSAFIEPSLIEPTILHDYPIELSPFAHLTEDDPTLVERFEAFVGGMELANAFSELNDPEEQARRFAMQSQERAAGAASAEEGDPDYVEAMSYGMPPNGGCGIGIDRLAMVLTGRDNIRDVILFPALRERH